MLPLPIRELDDELELEVLGENLTPVVDRVVRLVVVVAVDEIVSLVAVALVLDRDPDDEEELLELELLDDEEELLELELLETEGEFGVLGGKLEELPPPPLELPEIEGESGAAVGCGGV